MITQTAQGLNSRSEANIFDKNGFLKYDTIMTQKIRFLA